MYSVTVRPQKVLIVNADKKSEDDTIVSSSGGVTK